MRKLISLLFLSVMVAAPLADAANAGENGRGRNDRGGWAGAQRNDRGGREPGWSQGDRGRGYRNLPAAARGRDDNPGRGVGRQNREDREDRDYRAPQGRAPEGRAYREAPRDDGGRYGRGDYLYEPDRGARVPDPGRLRLREAPPGYDWMSVGGDLVLRQRSTGRIVESVPGGDAPPPRGRR